MDLEPNISNVEISKKKTEVFSSVSTMAFVNFIIKLLGLTRFWLIGAKFGIGRQSDVIMAGFRAPNLLFGTIFAGGVTSSFVPIFNKYLRDEKKDKAFDFANSFLTTLLIITIFIAIIGIFLAKPIVSLFMIGQENKLQDAAHFMKISFPSIIFMSEIYALTGILHSYGIFAISSFLGLISNFTTVVYLLLKNPTPNGLAAVTLFGWITQFLSHFFLLYKTDYRYKFSFKISKEDLKKILHLGIPSMVSSFILPLPLAITLRFASSMGDGWSSALEIANTFCTISVLVFVSAITNFTFPILSRFSDDNKAIKKILTHSLFLGLAVAATINILICFSTKEQFWSNLINKSQKSDSILKFLNFASKICFASIPITIFEILSRAFFATNKASISLIASLINFATACLIIFAGSNFPITKNLKTHKEIEIFKPTISVLSMIFGLLASTIFLLIFINRKEKVIDKNFLKELSKIALKISFLFLDLKIIHFVIIKLLLGINFWPNIIIGFIFLCLFLITFLKLLFKYMKKLKEAMEEYVN